jgi:hypothetical protein
MALQINALFSPLSSPSSIVFAAAAGEGPLHGYPTLTQPPQCGSSSCVPVFWGRGGSWSGSPPSYIPGCSMYLICSASCPPRLGSRSELRSAARVIFGVDTSLPLLPSPSPTLHRFSPSSLCSTLAIPRSSNSRFLIRCSFISSQLLWSCGYITTRLPYFLSLT